eukprot:gene4151-2588_t
MPGCLYGPAAELRDRMGTAAAALATLEQQQQKAGSDICSDDTISVESVESLRKQFLLVKTAVSEALSRDGEEMERLQCAKAAADD